MAGGAPDQEISEGSYRARNPAAAFVRHKLVETLAINSSREYLSTFVLCAGVLYGDGEEPLHPVFRQAWLCSPPALPVVGAGTNVIPTIHVADLAKLFVRLAERPPVAAPSNFLVAVDKARDTQQAIVAAISNALGTGQTATLDVGAAALDDTRPDAAERLAIMTSQVLVKREASWVASFEDLEWRSELGLVANVQSIIDEFVQARALRPIRLAICGPPGSAKSTVAKRVADLLYLPLINIRDVMARAKERMGAELVVGKDGKAALPVAAGIVRQELVRNEVRNKGYVLDGYPRSAEEAVALFEGDSKPADGDDADKAEEADDEEAAAKKPKIAIMPERVICMVATEQAAMARVKENIGTAIAGHSDEKGQARRWAAWTKAGLGGDSGPRKYYTDKGIDVYDLDGGASRTTTDETLLLYVQGGAPFFNYHPTEEEVR